jgi:ABC-2 type transport system ATP-binding protein
MDLWDLLKQVQKEQSITILLTTHFIEEADRCDHIALLNHGKILSMGTPSDLKQQLTFKWFQIKPKNLTSMQRLLHDEFKISTKLENGFLQFQVNPQIAAKMAHDLGSEVEELTYRDPSLEDVFVHFTGKKMNESGVSS